ncbi:MAG: hypothetical protein GXP30_01455 [Verrucomicrobia bacterium]|nr:hypothetical protein [Verrucomicrobiota bacterium]
MWWEDGLLGILLKKVVGIGRSALFRIEFFYKKRNEFRICALGQCVFTGYLRVMLLGKYMNIEEPPFISCQRCVGIGYMKLSKDA